MTPAYAVPGYVHAVTQSGGCWDQDLSSVQAETGEPEKYSVATNAIWMEEKFCTIVSVWEEEGNHNLYYMSCFGCAV